MSESMGLQRLWRAAGKAYTGFVADDGWAIASHIALSGLMSLFPFLIFVTTLAAFLGSKPLADEVMRLVLQAWPNQVAAPIATEMHNVLTRPPADLLTLGVLLAVYFSSNGVESLRVGLNRAYGVKEERPWYVVRLESIGYVLAGGVCLLTLAFLTALGPLISARTFRLGAALEPYGPMVTFTRVFFATALILGFLVLMHFRLPRGKRGLRQILPGVVLTATLSLGAGLIFGAYLEQAAQNYVATYAGLASAMIALVFLYAIASIFIYGAEFNAALGRV
jgi:membrane protein